MAQENPNRLAEWLLLLRRQWPVARRRFMDWQEAAREEPALIWATPAVRYAVYGLAGLLLTWSAVKLSAMLVSPPPANARPAATTADYHVVCANLKCAHHFVIHRKFGFRGFPVACPACGQDTGREARRCHSPSCQGRWVAAEHSDGATRCFECGRPFE
jgi:hypothetical protein